MLFSLRGPCGSQVSHQIQGHFLHSLPAARAIQQYASWRTVIAYRAALDVPRELAQFTARLLAAERRRRGTPRDSRALTCFWQAVLGLRSATAPPPMRSPVTTASRKLPPTGTSTR